MGHSPNTGLIFVPVSALNETENIHFTVVHALMIFHLEVIRLLRGKWTEAQVTSRGTFFLKV